MKGAGTSLRRLEETERCDHTGRGQRNLTMVPRDGKELGENELGVPAQLTLPVPALPSSSPSSLSVFPTCDLVIGLSTLWQKVAEGN